MFTTAPVSMKNPPPRLAAVFDAIVVLEIVADDDPVMPRPAP
jgi:hypothetical protein